MPFDCLGDAWPFDCFGDPWPFEYFGDSKNWTLEFWFFYIKLFSSKNEF